MSRNIHIEIVKTDESALLFFFADAKKFSRVSRVLPAVVDYDDTGSISRIEILFLQSVLEDYKLHLPRNHVAQASDIVLQVGEELPVSFLIWLKNIQKSYATHFSTDAWLLVDQDAQPCGIEIRQRSH